MISYTSSQFSNSTNFKHAILGSVRVTLESISMQLKYNLTTNDESSTSTPRAELVPLSEVSTACSALAHTR